MSDSDFSVSESSEKRSSTSTTTANPPSGNISENECSIDNVSRESSHDGPAANIIASETNGSELIKQEDQKQLATAEVEDINESVTGDDKEANDSKIGMVDLESSESRLQIAKRVVGQKNVEESDSSSKSEDSSSNSVSSTGDTEKKCKKQSSVQEKTCTSVSCSIVAS